MVGQAPPAHSNLFADPVQAVLVARPAVRRSVSGARRRARTRLIISSGPIPECLRQLERDVSQKKKQKERGT